MRNLVYIILFTVTLLLGCKPQKQLTTEFINKVDSIYHNDTTSLTMADIAFKEGLYNLPRKQFKKVTRLIKLDNQTTKQNNKQVIKESKIDLANNKVNTKHQTKRDRLDTKQTIKTSVWRNIRGVFGRLGLLMFFVLVLFIVKKTVWK